MRRQKLFRGGALLAACLLAISAAAVPVFADEESEASSSVTESAESADSTDSTDSAESEDAQEDAEDSDDADDTADSTDEDEVETFVSGDYTYSIHSEADTGDAQTICIESYSGTDTVLELPAELDGKKVTALGEKLLTEADQIEEITLPASVKELGAFTFASCRNLKAYHVAEGDSIFESRDGILYAGDGKLLMRYPIGLEPTEFTVPEGVTDIGSVAFAGCRTLEKITLPESLVYIGVGAFTDCAVLNNVTVPSGVTEIEAFTFNSCSLLDTITLPDTITRIGNAAFAATALKSFEFPASCASVGQQAFAATKMKEVTIPNTVTSLGYAAFGYVTTSEGMLVMDPDFVIYAELGSEGARYAVEGDDSGYFKFESIGGEDTPTIGTAAPQSEPEPENKGIFKIIGIIVCAILLAVILLIALLSGKKRSAKPDAADAETADADISADTDETTDAAAEAEPDEADEANAAEPEAALTEKEETGDE